MFSSVLLATSGGSGGRGAPTLRMQMDTEVRGVRQSVSIIIAASETGRVFYTDSTDMACKACQCQARLSSKQSFISVDNASSHARRARCRQPALSSSPPAWAQLVATLQLPR
jgi:hypothetical protein